jgi:hypothetical protein
LDLLSGSDEGHTVHRGHHSLLNDLSGNIAFEAFSYLKELRISLIFDLSND